MTDRPCSRQSRSLTLRIPYRLFLLEIYFRCWTKSAAQNIRWLCTCPLSMWVTAVQQDTAPEFTFPGLTIHPYQRQVFRGEKEIPLTHLEFSVLLYLAQQPGRVFSQRQIFEAVWNMDSETCQHSVVSIIHQLRKKIEPDPAQPVYIQTVIHTGYKFVIPKE